MLWYVVIYCALPFLHNIFHHCDPMRHFFIVPAMIWKPTCFSRVGRDLWAGWARRKPAKSRKTTSCSSCGRCRSSWCMWMCRVSNTSFPFNIWLFNMLSYLIFDHRISSDISSVLISITYWLHYRCITANCIQFNEPKNTFIIKSLQASHGFTLPCKPSKAWRLVKVSTCAWGVAPSGCGI